MFRDAEIKELTWRKSYRVWEANRKMLFFPENWLEPELRQDKSEIFKSIEEKLLQIDINEDTANDIFNEYVDKLDEISNLEILCAYNTGYYDWSTYNIHLLGRTKGSTGKYYYRQLKNNNNSFTWTPWEEVANGIKADAAGLCEFRGNLYMFWPEIYTVTQLEKGKEYAYTFRETDDNESVDTTREYTAVRLAWSVYKNGKWGKAVFSNDYMVEPLNKGGLKNFILNIMRNGDTNVEIQVLFGAPKTNNFPYTKLLSRGRFIFNGNELVFKYRYDLNNGDIGTSDTNRINAMFGDHKIENNKMLCKWKDNHSFFTLYYYKEQFTSPITYDILYTENRGNIGLFKENLAIKNADYTITSSLMNVAISSWLMKPSNAVYLFKHLVLEQSRVAKSFLGIPYPSIKIVDVNNLDQNINSLKYRFVKLYHPYINEIRTTLKLGYRSIFDIAFQDSSNKSLQIEGKSFGDYYGADSIVVSPVKEALVFTNDDDKDLFYSSNDATKLKVKDAYSSYNWELFYHIPVLIANNLSNNMQFEEAQKWYHLIFDPTTGSSEPAPKRYWRIKAFRELFNSSGQLTAASNIQDIIHDINERRSAYADIVDRWEESPFNPHLIAQYRPVAYMQYVVVKYINNLINWADMLFTRDSREDINQASLLYILAAEMLGARPQKIEGTLSEPKSYKQLQSDGPDLISNVFETITGLVAVMTSGTYSSNSINFGSATYRVSYFAVPHNDNMEQYWDTVADRLFKIRHSMNIKGVYRELAITSPPIDPGMLAAALAGGADLSSAINTLSAPMPLYRFTYMLQKALEFTNDVKSLGNTMLSVLEKKDAEDMAVLRATHEKALLNAMTFIREKAVEEAQENIAALEQTRAITEARMQEYRSREEISRQENTAMIMNKTALAARDKAAMFNTLSSIIAAIPQFRASMPPAATFGGVHLVNIFNAIALNMTHISDIIQTEAREVDTKASYARRYQDWQFQAAQAEMELPQIDSQIETAKIRLLMAESELENHKLQVAQKTEEFDFIKTKFTNVQLYNWMKGQIANIYQQAYQMAHKLAIAAEKAYIFEKQKSGYDSFIKFGYWDNLKQGLMSGELLYNDLRRLELEYIENNEREPELSKDIPLSMISPDALLRLKAEGRCDFDIPEMLYDIDYPGHYMRRIKAVSISIPAVTGPYSGISCKLSLLSNRFRNTASVGNSYAYSGINDSRFIHNIIGIQSISTSTGNNDSGMFEFNFNDERYLPFEGAGATGKWQIELPDVIRKFDYETISDVILHVKYTAKDAGGLLKTAANDNIIENINKFMDEIAEEGSELQIIHSMKTEFPDEYYELEKGNSVSLKIEKKHLPFIFTNYADRQEGKSLKIFSVKCVSPDLGITAIASFDDGEVLDNSGIVIDIAPGSLNFEDGKDSYLALSYKVVG
jgi:hypothetical protein